MHRIVSNETAQLSERCNTSGFAPACYRKFDVIGCAVVREGFVDLSNRIIARRERATPAHRNMSQRCVEPLAFEFNLIWPNRFLASCRRCTFDHTSVLKPLQGRIAPAFVVLHPVKSAILAPCVAPPFCFRILYTSSGCSTFWVFKVGCMRPCHRALRHLHARDSVSRFVDSILRERFAVSDLPCGSASREPLQM